MHTITPHIKKVITNLAGRLPMIMVDTHEKHILTKAELDEIGYADAQKLPDGTYIYKAPVQIAMNHYRGLKKHFKKEGPEGFKTYSNKIIEIIKQN